MSRVEKKTGMRDGQSCVFRSATTRVRNSTLDKYYWEANKFVLAHCLCRKVELNHVLNASLSPPEFLHLPFLRNFG